jgi:predicted deacylase
MRKTRREFLKITGKFSAGIPLIALSGKGSENVRNNKAIVDHAVARLDDGRLISVPFWRIDSGYEGPSLLMTAAQHGNEVHGAEVAQRFKVAAQKLLIRGNIWLLPMTNLLAVQTRRHSIDLGPEQPGSLSKGHNMQRTWPGDPEGNDTERLAYALDQAVLRHCSHVVDMHCWNQFWAAEALTTADHEPSRLLGEVTITRFISYTNARIPDGPPMQAGQLFLKRGGTALVMELSGQFQMQERQVRIGLGSMINIAKLLGMFEGEPELINGPRAVRSPETSHEVVSLASGIFMVATGNNKNATLIPDDYVERGQLLGHIIRETDLRTVQVHAPVSGYLWQIGTCHPTCDASLPAQHPYVEEGNRLALIVTV